MRQSCFGTAWWRRLATVAALLASAAAAAGLVLSGGVLVVCQKVVSKAEGRLVTLAGVEPSETAQRLAREDGKDPRHIEVILRETVRVVRREDGHIAIIDDKTGMAVEVTGYGADNAAAFARIVDWNPAG